MREKDSKKNAIKKIFYSLIAIFILIIAFFITSMPLQLRRAIFPVAAALAFIFLILGILLIVLTIKSKVKGKLRFYLILTGIAPVLFLVCILLHNFVYGLFIVLFGENFWETSGFGDEPFFFIIAIFLCPIIFIVGMIGSLICMNSKKK